MCKQRNFYTVCTNDTGMVRSWSQLVRSWCADGTHMVSTVNRLQNLVRIQENLETRSNIQC